MNIFRTSRFVLTTKFDVCPLLVRHKVLLSRSGGEGVRWWRRGSAPTAAIIRLSGPIIDGQSGGPGSRRINYANVRPLLEKISSLRRLDALVLEINSPGGSPVQSDLIRNQVRRLAAKKKIPVLAYLEDQAASGGYYLACAGDEIFVNPSSLVGSIGAIYGGLGFQHVIRRWEVERRIMTAGKNKALFDPLSELSEASLINMRRMLDAIHHEFIAVVKTARGTRLKESPETPLFEGDIFPARLAVELGLADAVAPSVEGLLAERLGPSVVMYRAQQRANFGQLLGGASTALEGLLGHRLMSEGGGSVDFVQRLFVEDALRRWESGPRI